MDHPLISFLIVLAFSIYFFFRKPTLLGGIGWGSLVIMCLAALLFQPLPGVCLLIFAGSYLCLAALAFAFLYIICALVDVEKPQEEDSPFYRFFMNLYIEALISLVLVRLHTRGLEKTPKDGRFLLVCNHLFLADPGILLHCFRNSQVAFITKKENAAMPIVGKFIHKTLCQSIDRENDRQALKTILKCIQLIKEDKVSIGVFPEGYTSKDSKLHPFRPGAFKIAQKCNVPIVVCTIQNTRMIFKNLKRLKKTDVELHLVDVIQPEDYAGMTTVELADKVHAMMLADLGDDYRLEES